MDNSTCPKNYPLGAPVHVCGHVSFAEMDAQAAYKQAMAYAITKDDRHARNAMRIVTAWAKTNKKFGLKSKNGPLEAAWCAREGGARGAAGGRSDLRSRRVESQDALVKHLSIGEPTMIT